MRGSQRARDILQAMGADAFKFHTVYRGFGPNAPQTRQRPLSGRQIAQLKKEYILENKCVVTFCVVTFFPFHCKARSVSRR